MISIIRSQQFQNVMPYQEGYLKVSLIHEIWYGQYGNPNGVLEPYGGLLWEGYRADAPSEWKK